MGAAIPASGQVPPAERQALIALYQATGGDGWTRRAGWLGPVGTECTWAGVTCSLGRVSVLDLGSNNLTGTIPREIGGLALLQSLGLAANELTGPIPAEITNLVFLRYLFLRFNDLTGPLPNGLQQLTQLEWLDVLGNRLDGPLPAALGGLSRMRYLWLAGNAFEGPIPAGIWNLQDLEEIRLGGGPLTGQIPAAVGNLSRLRFLGIDRANLEGTIPPQVTQLTELTTILLTDNQLSGQIPANLGNLSNLEVFGVGGNRLTGTIPTNIGNLKKLRFLNLDRNLLSGELPSSLWTLPALEQLILNNNLFEGTVPGAIGQLPALVRLTMDANRFRGQLPAQLAVFTDMQFATFRWNALAADDPAVQQFLRGGSLRQHAPDTQTLPPTDLRIDPVDERSVLLRWSPITFSAFNGGYRVFVRRQGEASFVSAGEALDKTASELLVQGLEPGGVYELYAQAFTLPHAGNAGEVISEPSELVAGTTAPSNAAGRIELVVSELRAAEGERKDIRVRRLGGAAGPAAIDFEVEGITAAAGSDFTPTSGRLEWADGEAGTKTFPIPFRSDVVPEGLETVRVRIRRATGAALGDRATGMLSLVEPDLRDDAEPSELQSRGAQPAAAADRLGRRVVAYTGSDGAGTGILVQRFEADGRALGPPAIANAAVAGDQIAPDIAASDDGFVVVWESAGTILGRRFDKNGVPMSNDERLDVNGGVAPAVATTPAGEIVVVWEDLFGNQAGRGAATASVLGRRFDPSGQPLTPPTSLGQGFPGSEATPDVAVESDGTAVVVWQGASAGNTPSVVGRRFTPPGQVEPPVEVAPLGGTAAGRPQVAPAGEPGDVLVVWEDQGLPEGEALVEPGADINARRTDFVSGEHGPAFRVNKNSAGNQTAPRVVATPAGDCVLAWAEEGSADPAIAARVLAGCGPVGGPELRVEGDGVPLRAPALALDGSQGVTVAYALDDRAESDGGIAAAWSAAALTTAPCVPTSTRLCLSGGRFGVELAFATAAGAGGQGQATSLTSDTGYFWFFDANNVEAVVKVLAACGVNGQHWVFAAGLTDVEATLTVVDSATGAVRTYRNPLGTPFRPILDTAAFPCS